MSITKNTPSVATSVGRPCTYCGKTTYSRSGIHPQCAAASADAKVLMARKRAAQRQRDR